MPPLASPPDLPALRTDEPLLWLAGCGHQIRRGADYYYDAGMRADQPHVVFQLTLDGVGFIKRRGEPRRLLPVGHAFFERIPGPFEYGWASGDYEQVFISFAGPAAQEWHRQITRLHGQVFNLGADPSVAQTVVSFVDAHSSGRLLDRYLISGQLYGVLMHVLSVLARRRIAATPLVTECIRLIHAEADRTGLNVNELAGRLFRSREHLSREFADAIGISPSAYLAQTRVRLAAAELRAGAAKLETVARRSGFSSAAYLCRVFHKSVGVTPVQFRDRPWLVAP